MSSSKKLITRGILLLASFFVVLAVIFMPVFPGKVNGLDYLDNLFNMISKGSSNFIPAVTQEVEKYENQTIKVTFSMKDEQQAQQTVQLFTASGASASANGTELTVEGDMGKILLASLSDASALFSNESGELNTKYGFSGKQVVYNWWNASIGIQLSLNKQQAFDKAKVFSTLQKRALEPAYNYYGIEASSYKDNLALVIVALTFYVFYTLWYGFGILYLFEGLGLRIAH
ncbi:MAG: hypothetical protein QNJ17_07735 [Desulfocapsaceae bacterium]|nr:hypothetical protein [Desulfocapsaceae bacterium]